MISTNDKTHPKAGDDVWALVDTTNGYIKVPVEATVLKIHKRRKNKFTVQAGNVSYEVPYVYLNKETCFETAILSLRVGLSVLSCVKKKLEGTDDIRVIDEQILSLQSTIDLLLFSSGS